jgi:hypothetical protein
MADILPSDRSFAEPHNVAVITTSEIIERKHPILYVSHDVDDGSWQFHSGAEVNIEEAKVISLSEIVELDKSLLALADLPLGWIAVRSSQDSFWQYSKSS